MQREEGVLCSNQEHCVERNHQDGGGGGTSKKWNQYNDKGGTFYAHFIYLFTQLHGERVSEWAIVNSQGGGALGPRTKKVCQDAHDLHKN